MWDTWTEFMNDYDVLISPTLASATFPLTQFAPDWLQGKSLREQLLDWLLTYPYNMLNNPAITGRPDSPGRTSGRPADRCAAPPGCARAPGRGEPGAGAAVGGSASGGVGHSRFGAMSERCETAAGDRT